MDVLAVSNLQIVAGISCGRRRLKGRSEKIEIARSEKETTKKEKQRKRQALEHEETQPSPASSQNLHSLASHAHPNCGKFQKRNSKYFAEERERHNRKHLRQISEIVRTLEKESVVQSDAKNTEDGRNLQKADAIREWCVDGLKSVNIMKRLK